MFATVEVRWFFTGEIPPDVDAWFAHSGRFPTPPTRRTDHYLRHPDDALGLKLREGRIEAKQRTARLGLVNFGPHARGVVETWRKWSFPLAETQDVDAAWTAVTKARRLHHFAIAPDAQLIAIHPQTVAARGCDWELTAVSTAGQAWWTLGLEAFGPGPTRETDLLRVARHFLGGVDTPPLPASNSGSYPWWLAQLDT